MRAAARSVTEHHRLRVEIVDEGRRTRRPTLVLVTRPTPGWRYAMAPGALQAHHDPAARVHIAVGMAERRGMAVPRRLKGIAGEGHDATAASIAVVSAPSMRAKKALWPYWLQCARGR